MDNGASSYRRFLDGDESAFGCIMKELFHGLVFFIDGFVHDTQAAEDIAIDTFSDLIVHRHRYNFKVSLKTYLYMVGRSRALDYLKHRKTIRFVELSEANEISDDSASLEEMVLADERKRLIHGAIGQLPEEMRVAVHLVYFEEMTYEETAKVMKKNRKQVDNLLYRAKKALRITLEKNGESVL
jgi:RNA polymerase sigma-70 factor (ECF subfamily)